ncbi:hypothetical protein ACE1SV_34220 [Streptomyces sp. E-15]
MRPEEPAGLRPGALTPIALIHLLYRHSDEERQRDGAAELDLAQCGPANKELSGLNGAE